jgi:hypothetical protein
VRERSANVIDGRAATVPEGWPWLRRMSRPSRIAA